MNSLQEKWKFYNETGDRSHLTNEEFIFLNKRAHAAGRRLFIRSFKLCIIACLKFNFKHAIIRFNQVLICLKSMKRHRNFSKINKV